MSLNNDIATIPVAAVVFREDLYPRIHHSAETVQKYAEDLDVLPPIEVNQHHELIDGWHRWTAHRKREAPEIRARITPTQSDADLLEIAIERNASHGLQLSQEDKRDMARRIYAHTPQAEREAKKAHLARILSVSERTVREWLGRIDKDAKEKLRKQAFEMWLAMHTQAEIAEAIGYSVPHVNEFIKNTTLFGNGESAVSEQSADTAEDEEDDDSNSLGRIKLTAAQLAQAAHADDAFDAPIYNIWKQQEKSKGAKHFGNSEVRWVDNLLYLYTKPFDVVVDPFAGGGSTIDICKKRLRRYWISDRKPVVEREKEIRKLDLTAELPPLHKRWSEVRFVYLDPPYWLQAAGQYSEDPTDLANMPLDQFNAALAGIINGFGKKLSNAHIALIIQPTQWKAPERQYTDHIGDMLRMVKLPVDMRFSVPYESQQCNAQMVEWAKEAKRCLVLTREIIVWRVA